jgi:uncharacterized protein YjbI with pentapeptide repeats
VRSVSEITIEEKRMTEIMSAHSEWVGDNKTGIRADLRHANLSGADLSHADLSGAYLNDANLSCAYLSGADLSDANGIYAFGPIGDNDRVGYAVKHTDGVMFKLGCHWGNLDATLTAINKKYGMDSLYEKQVILAGQILESKNERKTRIPDHS